MFHCNEGVTYEPGSIKIYVPDALFLSRTGGSVYNNSAVQLGVPKAPNTNTESSFNWSYDSATKCKVITNWETINSTLDFKCEFKYQVDYKQWNGVYDIRSGEWFDCPIYVTIQDQGADEPGKLAADVLKAQVLTDVTIGKTRRTRLTAS
ncbi:MAG: hypothetical protein PUE49_08380 [Eggerthellales bacterium]|nr:hypothetical protein [Eggerthellales bacterium]